MASIDNKVSTEKEVGLSTSIPLPVAASQIKPISDSSDLDKAFRYIQNASSGDKDTATSVDLAALRWRVDRHILPLLFLCTILQFLDKVNLNYAAVMGLNEDLHLTGNDFSNLSTGFFVAYLIFEVPNGFVLQKLPAGKWFAGNMIVWGIVTACTAAVNNYTTLLIVRVVLGVFESTITPSVLLISSQWYTRREQALRFAFWYCGSAFGQILGGFISFGFQHVGSGASLAGWRIMFIVFGVMTVPVGMLAWWTLPATPMTAKWMSKVEKIALLNHLSQNRTGIENHRFKLSQLVELLLDVQMWLMVLITILNSLSSGIILSYSSTIIRNFGYTPKIATLLGTPSGAVSILANVIVACGITFVTKGHRWVWVVACSISGIVAGSLLSFSPTSNRAALLTGIYLVTSVTPSGILIYQLTMTNVAGHTKRPIASAMVAGSFSIGNIIGPQTFQAKDAPQYHSAKIIFLASQAGAAILTCVLFVYYVLANRQKDRRQKKLMSEGVDINSLEYTWGNLTDKENVEFRYAY